MGTIAFRSAFTRSGSGIFGVRTMSIFRAAKLQ